MLPSRNFGLNLCVLRSRMMAPLLVRVSVVASLTFPAASRARSTRNVDIRCVTVLWSSAAGKVTLLRSRMPPPLLPPTLRSFVLRFALVCSLHSPQRTREKSNVLVRQHFPRILEPTAHDPLSSAGTAPCCRLCSRSLRLVAWLAG